LKNEHILEQNKIELQIQSEKNIISESKEKYKECTDNKNELNLTHKETEEDLINELDKITVELKNVEINEKDL